MVRTRKLRHEEVTYSRVFEEDTNVLIALEDPKKTTKLLANLIRHKPVIGEAVAHHLGILPEQCDIADPKDWLLGGFNVCLPVSTPKQKVLIRFPVLHRVGDDFRPGNADEKIRCEVGTYAWLAKNCPSVPVPKLYGFGLSTGQTFTVVENLPMLSRWFHYIRCGLLRLFGYETPSNYVRHGGPCLDVLKAGYLLLEFIDETRGKMLACTWEDHRHRKDLRTNLFKGLSRIMLTIAKVPVPRIGSFTLDDQGFLVLNNRPLTMEIQQLEAEKIPTNIARDTTYSSVESYVHDSLAVHDNRLDYQPNAISDRLDGISQVASLTIMKAVFTHFFARKFRRGPFVFILNDLHQGNIFVDENWNITCLIDLEWACSRPIEMLHPPHWLTTRWVDQIDLDEYTPLHQEFIKCCEEEEQQFQIEGAVSISELMNRGWDNGSFWYSLALKSPAGLYPLFYDNIRPLFTKNEDPKMVGYFASVAKHYWTPDLEDFLARKLKDKAFYDEKLREEFDVEPAP